MTHTAPEAPSLWHRIVAAIRYVLTLEPVVAQAVIRAVFVLVAATGITVPEWVEPRVVAVAVALYALVELLTTLAARRRVTPAATVVEQAVDGTVVAGPANEIATGTVIRQIDSGALWR